MLQGRGTAGGSAFFWIEKCVWGKDYKMLRINNYVRVKSLEEAYELNQKRTACVLGGMVWLKMTNRRVGTAIDLSDLALDYIQETEEEFRIGCMTPLHELEIHKGLNVYTQGAVRESLRHIVGVQFRNCATVGGSIYGRYGFSDVLTMFMGMDTEAELYHAGRIRLEDFARNRYPGDILVQLVVKKRPLKTVYISQRNTETDFPVLTVCASLLDGQAKTVIGARPQRAVILEDAEGILTGFQALSQEEQRQQAEAFASYAASHVKTGSNLRASAQYRSHLVKVLVRRAWEQLGGQK